MTEPHARLSAANGYADLVRELGQAAEEYDRGHGPLHAAAANAIQHLETLLQSRAPAQCDAASDPTANPAWNDGCDYAMTQLCLFLGVNQNDVRWDAATETVEGDVQAVIGNILRAKFGEDWGPSDCLTPAASETPPDWKQDQADTSVLPRKPIPAAYEVERLQAEVKQLCEDLEALRAAPTKEEIELRLEVIRLRKEADAAHAEVVHTQDELGALLHAAEAKLAQVLSQVEGASARPRNFYAWAVEMFGPVAKLRSERLMRFVEEAIELAHADEMERSTFDAIANRVYSRPRGEITKEIGQAQACLETYAESIGESSALCAEIEWQRVQKIPRAEWERRHSAKQAIGIALSHTSTERSDGM